MSDYPLDNTSNDQSQTFKARLKGLLSRRGLLTSAIFSGTAAAVILSRPERNVAQEVNNETSVRVKRVLAAADTTYPLSNNDQDSFLKAANIILGVVEKDANVRASYNALHAYLAQTLIQVESQSKVTSLGLPQEVSDTIAAGYLCVTKILRDGSLSEEAVLTKLNNPKAVFDSFEEDFIASLSKAVQAKAQSHTPFAYALSDATEQIVSIGNSIPIPQDWSQQGRGCTIGGNPRPMWMCIGIVIAVLVVIILYL